MRYTQTRSFQKHLASASTVELCRSYYLLLTDPYEQRKALKFCLSYLLSPEDFAIELDAKDLSMQDIAYAFSSVSLFGKDPVVVIFDADKLDKKVSKSLELFLNPSSFSAYLVCLATSKSSLMSKIEEVGVILDLSQEKPWDKEKRLMDFVQNKVRSAGKRVSLEALTTFFKVLDKELALVEQEIYKLITYVGSRDTIEVRDVLAICTQSMQHTLWQVAETIVWDHVSLINLQEGQLQAVIPLIRSQLNIGLKLSKLIEAKVPSETWNLYLPKMWPKALQKKSSLAAVFGSYYFVEGLKVLFHIEYLTRLGSVETPPLLDLVRSRLKALYVR